MGTLVRTFRAKAYSEKETPWRSLVFTLLSARTRDEQTEVVYKKLCDRFETAKALAKSNQKEIETYIKTIGLFHTKATHLLALANVLVKKYNGRVPEDFDALVSLPGVGRKTANCVLVYAFKKPAIPVDTHVHRVANRLGWVNTRTPEQTETALREVVPKRWWMDLNRVMVQFGRTVCVPGRPKCIDCPVRAHCTFLNKNL